MTNKTVIAKDKKHLQQLVKLAIKENGNNCDLNFIDVSNVTDMSEMIVEFEFDGDISEWDDSNVTDTSEMFAETEFDGDISDWGLT